MSTFLKTVVKQARETSLGQIRGGLLDTSSSAVTLAEILRDLEEQPTMKEHFLSVTVSELKEWFTAPAEKAKRAKSESTDVPVENWETAREGHTAAVLAFLTEQGLGTGDHARGFTPAALREKLHGTETQMREVLKALEDAGKVVFTGGTKGKKYVVASLKAQAEKVFAAEQEAKAKAESEKAQRKAEAEKSGKAAKGTKKA